MIFGEIDSLFSLFARVKKLFNIKNLNQVSDTIASRFVRLFESHGVHRNQIPRFIGHGLTIADVKDDETLLPKLTEEILDAACEKFSVRREWLDGAELKIHPEHDFYKYPQRFKKFLLKLNLGKTNMDVQGVLIVPEESTRDAHALMILQETIGCLGDKPIYRFHLCNNWAYSYWKARAYLVACIAISSKNHNYIYAITKPKAFIDELAYGKSLLGWSGEGVWGIGHKSFDPEYMALRPKYFLKDIEPEEGDFGIKSALDLWLKLNEQGLMDAGFGNHDQAFMKELEKYKNI